MAEAFGAHWWFHFGKALCEVIMPEDCFMISAFIFLDEIPGKRWIMLCTSWKDVSGWC